MLIRSSTIKNRTLCDGHRISARRSSCSACWMARNLVVSAPTSSGKTLVGELAARSSFPLK